MTDAGETDSGGRAAEGDERRARRQQRLRQMLGSGAGRGAAAKAPAGGGGPAAAANGAGGGAGAIPEKRRKALGRIARILTDTPADAAGMVPGTPFTQAGVAALLDTLGKRSRKEGAPGARVASRLLTFLQADKDGAEGAVHGVSVQKLQRLAKLAGGKGRRGASREADRGTGRGISQQEVAGP